MTQDLLLMAWPYQGNVLTSLRWATDYFMPLPYKSNTTVDQISSKVNATGFELIFRCRNCFSWAQGSYNESVNTSTNDGFLLFGFAQAGQGPQNAGCPDRITFDFHDNGYGQWGALAANATRASYSKWAALPTQAVNVTCTGGALPSASASLTSSSSSAAALPTSAS